MPNPISTGRAAESNPGSPEATEAGCTCPVIDNYYGRGIPHRDGPLFWFNAGCPIHGEHGRAAESAGDG